MCITCNLNGWKRGNSNQKIYEYLDEGQSDYYMAFHMHLVQAYIEQSICMSQNL